MQKAYSVICEKSKSQLAKNQIFAGKIILFQTGFD